MNIVRMEKTIDALFDDAVNGMLNIQMDIKHFKEALQANNPTDDISRFLNLDVKNILGNTRISLPEKQDVDESIEDIISKGKKKTEREKLARQPDYRKIKNRALMSMMGCIETPDLLRNEHFPGYMVDNFFTCYEKRFGGSKYQLDAAATYLVDKTPVDTTNKSKMNFLIQRKMLDASKNVHSNRDLLVDSMIDGIIDFNRIMRDAGTDSLKIREKTWVPEERDMMQVARSVPLDIDTRLFLMGNVDGWETIQDYVDMTPDGGIPREMEDTILGVFLETEQMIAETPDKFDDATIEKISLIEWKALSSRRIEKFSMNFATTLALYSGFPGTRSLAACYPNLPDDVVNALANDPHPDVRASIANCTDKCDVLMQVKRAGGLDAKSARYVNTRIKILGCK